MGMTAVLSNALLQASASTYERLRGLGEGESLDCTIVEKKSRRFIEGHKIKASPRPSPYHNGRRPPRPNLPRPFSSCLHTLACR